MTIGKISLFVLAAGLTLSSCAKKMNATDSGATAAATGTSAVQNASAREVSKEVITDKATVTGQGSNATVDPSRVPAAVR